MNDLVTIGNTDSFERVELAAPNDKGSFTDDFDLHASLYRGIDVRLMQLSEGGFRSRFNSALSEKISIHLAVCAQSVEQHMIADANRFVFCLSPSETDSHAVFGHANSNASVLVLPPRGEAVAIVPADVPLLTMAVDRDLLLQGSSLLPDVAAWLQALGPDGELINSQTLVSRLRTDGYAKLQHAIEHQDHEQRRTMDQLCASNVANSFSLEWLKEGRFHSPKRPAALERFLKARCVVRQNPHNLAGNGQHAIFQLGSKRSVEQAFADQVDMGPLSYARLVRLHNARRKLRDQKFHRESIGNIAAQEGFWEWSRFTSYYGRHFGELPSQTRENAAPSDLSQKAMAG
ncbi:MAG: helix-turn-helix domain-containing protein [Pseudomonadota bacterium]